MREPPWVGKVAQPLPTQPCAISAPDRIGLPGLGVITIEQEQFIVEAATLDQTARVWACLGDAARALWWRSVGAQVTQGAVVARGDEVVLLTGASRLGASLTALGLWRRGWSLICDGVVPLLNNVAMMTAPEVVIDASALPLVGNPDAEESLADRPRVVVPITGHESASLTHTVTLRPRVAPIVPSATKDATKEANGIVCEWGWGGDQDRLLANLPIRVGEAIEQVLP